MKRERKGIANFNLVSFSFSKKHADLRLFFPFFSTSTSSTPHSLKKPGVSGLSDPDARVGIYAEPVETCRNGNNGNGNGSSGNASSSTSSSSTSTSEQQQLNRGVLALRDFAVGEELFRVPLRLAITDHIMRGNNGTGEKALSSTSSSSFDEDSNSNNGNSNTRKNDNSSDEIEAAAGRSHRDEPSAWGARLACRLLREKARGKASPWAPWLSVLPTTTTSVRVSSKNASSGETTETVVVRPGSLRSAWAGALPREVAALLPCPAASKALLAATTAADAEFAKLPKAALASVASAAAAALGSSSSSSPSSSSPSANEDNNASAMALYRWARAIVQSRTFGSTAKEEKREQEGGDEGGSNGSDGNGSDGNSASLSSPPPSLLPSVSLVRMLVPLADFVNHAGDETEGLLSGRAAPTANAEWKVVADYSSSDEDEIIRGGSGDVENDDDECDVEGRAAAAASRPAGRGKGRAGRGGGFSGVAEARVPRSPFSASSTSSACAPPPAAATSWSLVVSASRPLVAGEELSFSYGNRVNADFLVSYGFVPARNPHDAVCLFENVEEAVEWAAGRLQLGGGNDGDGDGGSSSSPSSASSAALLAAAVAAADRETPPSLARAIATSRDPEIVAEARRLWLWAGARVDERLAAALEVVVASSANSTANPTTPPPTMTAGELVAARAAELLSRSGAPPLSDALGELERAGEHEHEEQHYFRALKRRYAAKEPAVRRSAARASEAAAASAAAAAAASLLADAISPTSAPAAPLPPPPPRGGSRSTWRGVRLMALRAGVYSTMILWDALEAADKASSKKRRSEEA